MRMMFCGNDAAFGNLLKIHLEREHHVVDWVPASQALDRLASAGVYQCLLIDIGPCRHAHVELLRAALRHHPNLQGVALAEMSSPAQRIGLFDLGVDDILDKPVDLEELSARLRRLQRRHGARMAPSALRLGPLRVDAETRGVHWHDRPVALSKKEFRLLELFLHSRGRVIRRSDLEQSLYGDEREIVSNAVDVHIHNLRHKLAPEVIQAVRGVGYRLGSGLSDA